MRRLRQLSSRSRAALVLASVCLVAAIVGAVSALGNSTRGRTTLFAYSYRAALTHHTRSGVSPASALSSIVSSVDDSSVASAVLGGPPPGLHESDDPSVPNSVGFNNSLWLYVTVKAAALTPEATTRPLWLGNLITGALRDELYSAGQKPLYSSEVSIELPNATLDADVGGGIGGIEPGQVFSSASDASIRATLTASAAAAGYSIDSLDIVHADQPAPALVVTTTNPQAAAANPDAVLTAIFGPPGTYEGEYLEVHAEDGTLVFVQGSAFRTGVGQRWINPVYTGDQSGGGGFVPPAAPAATS